MAYFTREQWGARTPTKAGNAVTNGPLGVAVHYDGPPMYLDRMPVCTCARQVRAIQDYHMDKKAFSDIAYDLLACPHGNVFQGRYGTSMGTGANGSRFGNQNYMSVMGLFGEGDVLTQGLIDGILDGIQMCRDIGAGAEITGHSTFQVTDCPGDALWAWIRAGAPRDYLGDTNMAELTLTLRYGDRNDEVGLLQQMLNALQDAGLTVDNSFGSATETQVKEYQFQYGLASDGVVGPKTRTQLNTDWAAYLAGEIPPDPVEEEPTPDPVDEEPTPDPVEEQPAPVEEPVDEPPTDVVGSDIETRLRELVAEVIDYDAIAEIVVQKLLVKLQS